MYVCITTDGKIKKKERDFILQQQQARIKKRSVTLVMDANAAMKRCGEWKPQERHKKYYNNFDDTQQLRQETAEGNKMRRRGNSCRCIRKAEKQWQRHKDETKNKTTIYYTTTQRKIQQKSKAKQKTSREFESSNQQQPQHICTYTLLAGWSICKAIITTRKHMYKHTPAALLLQRS